MIKKLIVVLFLLSNIAIAEVDITYSLVGQSLAKKTVYVPEGASVLVSFSASVSHKSSYGRNWITLKRNGVNISDSYGNREHEDGSTTGLSDVISISVIDKPRRAGRFLYEAIWSVNGGVGYSGAKDFSILVIKP